MWKSLNSFEKKKKRKKKKTICWKTSFGRCTLFFMNLTVNVSIELTIKTWILIIPNECLALLSVMCEHVKNASNKMRYEFRVEQSLHQNEERCMKWNIDLDRLPITTVLTTENQKRMAVGEFYPIPTGRQCLEQASFSFAFTPKSVQRFIWIRLSRPSYKVTHYICGLWRQISIRWEKLTFIFISFRDYRKYWWMWMSA